MTADFSATGFGSGLQGLPDLRRSVRENSPEALQQVAKQFESLFIQMMLKSMRDAQLAEGIFDSEQSEIYTGMFDQQIAMQLAQQKSLGIADMLVKQLQEITGQPAPVMQKPFAETYPSRSAGFDTPNEFVETLRPVVEQAAGKSGINADAMIAQAALETGWGSRMIRKQDGSNSFNLFGIKTGKHWQGDSVTVPSMEYSDGRARMHYSSFRVYDSFQHSIDDYVKFISTNERYRDALASATDAYDYVNALQDAGYATDPDYAKKIMEILETGVL